MTSPIPESFRDILHSSALASLATVMPDGTPQVSPVWFDLEGDLIRINSARGRAKDRNMRRDPRVSLAIVDPENPYRYLEIRGKVTHITEDGADAHIDSLAFKYLGQERYPFRTPGEVRVTYKIQPHKVNTMG
ncbi:MAG: PPOX class F420-dependent oxidoreductase [Candidatus Eremiobacterota bacterium]